MLNVVLHLCIVHAAYFECIKFLLQGRNLNQSTITVFEDEQVHSTDHYALKGFNTSDPNDIPFFIQNYPQLIYQSGLSILDGCKFKDLEHFGFCYCFQNDTLRLKYVQFNFTDGQMLMNFKEEDRSIDLNFQKYIDCPLISIIQTDNLVMLCYNSHLTHIIVNHPQQLYFEIPLNFEQSKVDCYYQLDPYESLAFLSISKCQDWYIWQIDSEASNLISLIDVFPELKELKQKQQQLQKIRLRSGRIFIIFSNCILQYNPKNFDLVQFSALSASLENQTIVDLHIQQKHLNTLIVISSDNDETNYQYKEDRLILGKNDILRELIASQNTQILVFHNRIKLICYKIFTKEFYFDFKFAYLMHNIPYILIHNSNNVLELYEIKLPNELFISNQERYQNAYLINFYLDSHMILLHKVQYLSLEQNQLSCTNSFHIFELPNTALTQQFLVSKDFIFGPPCQTRVHTDKENLIKSIDAGKQLCPNKYFNSTQPFFQFQFNYENLFILQQGLYRFEKCFNEQDNNIVNYLFLENEITLNNIFFFKEEKYLIIRQEKTVLIYLINFSEQKIIHFLYYPSLKSINLVSDQLYIISEQGNKINSIIYSLMKNQIISNLTLECILQYQSLQYNLLQCNNTLILSNNQAQFHFNFWQYLRKIEILSEKQFITFELLNSKIVSKLYTIKFPSINFEYTLPFYQFSIITPITTSSSKFTYSILAKIEGQTQLYVMVFNYLDSATNSLKSIIKCDSFSFYTDESSIFYIYQNTLLVKQLKKLTFQFNPIIQREYRKIFNITLTCFSMINNSSIHFLQQFAIRKTDSMISLDPQKKLELVQENNNLTVNLMIHDYLMGPIEDLILINDGSQFQLLPPIQNITNMQIVCEKFDSNICHLNDKYLIYTSNSFQKIEKDQFKENEMSKIKYDFSKQEIQLFREVTKLVDLTLLKYKLQTKEKLFYTVQNDGMSIIQNIIALDPFECKLIGNLVFCHQNSNQLYFYYVFNQFLFPLQNQLEFKNLTDWDILQIQEEKNIYTIVQYNDFRVNVTTLFFENSFQNNGFQTYSNSTLIDLTDWAEFQRHKQSLEGFFTSLKTFRKNERYYQIMIFYTHISYIFEIGFQEQEKIELSYSFQLTGVLGYPYQAYLEKVVAFGGNLIFLKFQTLPFTYIYNIKICNRQHVYKIDPFYSFISKNVNHLERNTFIFYEAINNLFQQKIMVNLEIVDVNYWQISSFENLKYEYKIDLIAKNQNYNLTFSINFRPELIKQEQNILWIIISINFIIIIITLISFTRRVPNKKYNITK